MSSVRNPLSLYDDFYNRHARGSTHPYTSPPIKTANMEAYPLPSSASRAGPSDRVMRALEFDAAQKRRALDPESESAPAIRSTTSKDGPYHVSSANRRPSLPALFNRLTSEPSSPTSPGKVDAESIATASSEGKEPLLQLVYTSSSRDRYLPRSQLETILTSSRKTNAHNGITGLLLYRDGSFAQFLEGHRSAVLDTFERIRSDRRHRGVIVVLQRPVEKRDFSEWRMGFRDVDTELKEGNNDDEDRGEVGSSCVGQDGKEAVLDLSIARVADLSHAEMSRAIRTLIKVFHQSLARPV